MSFAIILYVRPFFQVFPPTFRELPPPSLELFDLDEQFSSEKVRIAQITNKCKSYWYNTMRSFFFVLLLFRSEDFFFLFNSKYHEILIERGK